MDIQSFIRSDFGLKPVRVEVVLVPGLSQIQILGMADPVIKESSRRILSALRHQGFRLPPGKQVLVNLQPNYVRKHSQGLDFAIAVGILLETKQIEMPLLKSEKVFYYGGLDLKGEVIVPEDMGLLNFENFSAQVMTGHSGQSYPFNVLECKDLATLSEATIKAAQPQLFTCQPTRVSAQVQFDSMMARLISLVALGEHPLLIAGAAGCGKTTLVEHLATLLSPPSHTTFMEAKKIWRLLGRDLKQRPILAPHHSITPMAMIGGGAHLQPGEISLAHGGVLILDELLEFHPQIQSALREPMEKGWIYLSRAGRRHSFPADSLFLATTNLCPCGSFQPGSIKPCRCSSLKLRNYVERLSGPFLDRFAIFHIYQKPKQSHLVSVDEIQKRLQKIRGFQEEKRQQKVANQKLGVAQLMTQLDAKVHLDLLPHSRSHRRRQSLLRVARSLADMDFSLKIKQKHLEEAQEWTARDIYRIERFSQDDFAAR
jgi:magnesium chelatase family protein